VCERKREREREKKRGRDIEIVPIFSRRSRGCQSSFE